MLSPAYDLLSTIPYIQDGNAALNYSRTRVMAELSEDELLHLAAKAHLPERMVLTVAAETIELFKAVWNTEKKNLPLSAAVIHAIDEHARKIAIYRGK